MGQLPTKVLIAVDGSDQSLEAVRYAGNTMASENTKLTVFHVMNPIPESFLDLESDPGFRHKVIGIHAWEFQQKKLLQDFLKKAERTLKAAGVRQDNFSVVTQAKKTGVARDIIQEAKGGYAAVVAGRTGLSKVKDLLFGSIANKLVAHLSGVPVCIVGGSPDPKKILVAMDSSEGALRTLDHVGNLFIDRNPEILLFHVIRGLAVFQPGYEELSLPAEQKDWVNVVKKEFKEAHDRIQAVFEDSIRKLEQRGADRNRIATRVVTGVPSRAETIVEHAKAGDYGTMVVGRKGASRIEEFLMGRVSNKVLQLAKGFAVWLVG